MLAPRPGAAMSLGIRDCSLQRRHQKLVEETPPPLRADLAPAIGRAAVAVADACGYTNAGTIEFLLDPDEGRFYFLEINARLQVEHTITEEVTGLDLVAAQIRIATGDPVGFGPDDLAPGGRHATRGHAIECRINAEDPARKFLPRPGTITGYREPSGPGIRVDSGFRAGDRIPPAYDSLVAKVVARGSGREEARRRMLRALEEFEIEGIATTIPAHVALLRHPDFLAGTHTTRTVEEGGLDALAPSPPAAPPEPIPSAGVLDVGGEPAPLWHPAMARVAAASSGGDAHHGDVLAPMHGTILSVLVSEGDPVSAGDAVAVLEAMKMETRIPAAAGGTVRALLVSAGEVVEAGQPVARVE